ncbi:MAG: hypothetical protein WC043_02965 [Pseudobdellovibrionaceae bacterium]
MKFTGSFTGSFEMEPEEFGRFLAAIPPDVRQQFIDSAIKAYPVMLTEFMKTSGASLPALPAPVFNVFDPFGLSQLLLGSTQSKRAP